MPNESVAFAAVLAGGVIAYSAFTHKRVIDVLLMRDSTLPQGATGTAPGQAFGDPTNVTGSRSEVVAVARKAAALSQSNPGTYQYAQVRPYPKSLFSDNKPIRTDCSGFVTLCYKEAGASDPNGSNYNGMGYTGTLEAHGKKTEHPQPGDLCFWSTPDHVAIYQGNGRIVGFGSNPGPSEGTIADEAKFHLSFLGYRSYLP